jgi:hypothetical protein
MAIKTLTESFVQTLNLDTFIDADVIRVGEAYAALFGFTNGDESSKTFGVDAGTYAALRRAACRIVGMPTDRTTDVHWYRKPGTKQWKRVSKTTRVGANDERKTTVVRSYSGDAVRKGIAMLRDDRGVSIRRDAERKTIDGDEYIIVALVRNAPADDDAPADDAN